jgi:hypothetical protein
MTDQELLTFVPPFVAEPIWKRIGNYPQVIGFNIYDSQGSWINVEEERFAAVNLEERYHKLEREEEE